MKVALLTQSISRRNGGVSEVARRHAQTLAEMPDTTVEAVGLRDEATDSDAPGWMPIQPRILAPTGPRSLGFSISAAAELREVDPDIAHLHGLFTALSGTTHNWSRATGKPCVISIHGMLDPWALQHSAWKKRLAGWLFENSAQRGAACLHAMTPAEVECIRARGLRQPVCLIPNGVDLPAAPIAAPPPWAGNVEAGRRVLLYLGRLHSKKGLPALLRAWRQLRPEWELVIAGWDQGGHEAELRAIDSGAHFAGPLHGAAKDAAYANADAFILPSLSEGLPLVVLEAWAHGLPVVMTPHCNLPAGFAADAALSTAPDVESIAATLRELFQMNDADRAAMGERGRLLVRREFAWPQIGAQMREVYAWLLGGGAQPACVSR